MSTPVGHRAQPGNLGEIFRVFWSVWEASPDGTTVFEPILDGDGNIADFSYAYVNPAGAAMVNLTPDALTGQRMCVLFPGVVETGILAGYVSAYQSDAPWQHELWYNHDGQETGFRIVAVRAGNFVVVTYSDITARLRAERQRDELLTRAAQLQTVTSELASAVDEVEIAQMAADRVRVLVGAQLVSILVADAAGDANDARTTLRLPSTRHLPTSAQRLVAEIPAHAAWPAPTAFVTGRVIVLTGQRDLLSQFPEAAPLAQALGVEASVCVPIQWNNKTLGVMAVDFAAARPRHELDALLPLLTAIAEQCARAMERARLIAGERAARAEVEVALHAVATTSAEKSAFLAEMSHEVRTPLQSIYAYLALLQHESQGSLSEGQRSTLRKMERSAERIGRLVDDVLEFAQLESGRLTIDIAPVSPRESIEAAEAIISPLLSAAGITLSVEDTVHREHVAAADPHRLQQILLNLLTNAIKHTPRDGRIVVRLCHSVEAGASAEQLRIDVQDSGRGIPSHELESIFEPFVQLPPNDAAPTPTGRLGNGVGLGLTISQRLARRMGGDLRASNAPERGAMFTLILPRWLR